MAISIIFFIIIGLILLRIFWLRLKASNAHSKNFQELPPKDQLAVLKECLLNSPAELNLQNLKSFLEKNSINCSIESYRPFIKQQLELRNKKDALEEDNQLFIQESQWLDQILPLEFNEASNAKEKGNLDEYISATLAGISRLYSDEAILQHLSELENDYPKAARLIQGYHELMELRDQSAADDESLSKLRQAKEAWEQELLQLD